MINRSYIKMHLSHPHGLSNSQLSGLKKQVSLSREDEAALHIVKNLSDPTKLRIYLLLSYVEEIAVSDITYILAISQSRASHALSDLKNLGLVETHRCGKLICYSLKKAKNQKDILRFLKQFKKETI